MTTRLQVTTPTMMRCPHCKVARQYIRVDDTVMVKDADGNRHTFGIRWGRSLCQNCDKETDADDLMEG